MTIASDLAGLVPRTVTWACVPLLSWSLSIQQLYAKGRWDAVFRGISNQSEPGPFGSRQSRNASTGAVASKQVFSGTRHGLRSLSFYKTTLKRQWYYSLVRL